MNGSEIAAMSFMKTLQSWINAHPGVNVLAFEGNSGKSFGFGVSEEVCGFCLASHYFDERPPGTCRFCRAPLRETHVISDLPSIKNRIYQYRFNSLPTVKNDVLQLRIVTNDKKRGLGKTKLVALDFDRVQ
jgi:hypothetical protein